jgi:hypothetical protein
VSNGVTDRSVSREASSAHGSIEMMGSGTAIRPRSSTIEWYEAALGQAIGVFAGVAYGVVVIAALLLPETRGS